MILTFLNLFKDLDIENMLFLNTFSAWAWFLTKTSNDVTSLQKQYKSVEVTGILCELGKYLVGKGKFIMKNIW